MLRVLNALDAQTCLDGFHGQILKMARTSRLRKDLAGLISRGMIHVAGLCTTTICLALSNLCHE